jgi:gliding motility-associated-like protein
MLALSNIINRRFGLIKTKRMKNIKYAFAASFLLLSNVVCAQFAQNGALISLSKDVSLSINQTDFIHQSGEVYLNGWLGLSGNWYNNDATSKVLNLASIGTVELTGVNQNIGGTTGSLFHNLILGGTGIKSVVITQEINGALDLTDRELALKDAEVFISSAEVTAIKRTAGFISSTTELSNVVRATTAGKSYLFPTGSATGNVLYRPVLLKGTDATDRFAVALFKKDPTANGLSTQTSFKNGLVDINQVYYHQIKQLDGAAPTALDILFDSKTDGNFKELAYWDKTSWLATKATALTGLYGDNLNAKVFKSALNMKGFNYFALANQTVKNDLFIPNSFSPNGDGKNEKWVIAGLEAYPDNQVKITNRWGDEIYNLKGYNESNAFDGRNLNEGTYYYFIKVDMNGANRTFAGYFTLLR